MFKFEMFKLGRLYRELTLCIMLSWYLSVIFLDRLRHFLAMLSSGKLSRCNQNLIIFMSIFAFNDNLPSSFLHATFGHCLLTPKKSLQK